MDEQTFKLLNKGMWFFHILIVGILAFLVVQLVLQNKSIDQQNSNQITVSGEGKVYAKPDVALVNLGVTTTAATVADVTKNNTNKMNSVIDAVKNLGVADKDIQTTNYDLEPVYANNYVIPPTAPVINPSGVGSVSSGTMIRTGTTLTGYKLEEDVQIKIRDFTKIGDVLSKATAAGANQIGDLQFTIDNPEQFKDQARAEAIAQAKADAENLAKESGINLGKIINIYENNYVVPMAYNSVAKAGGGVAESAPTPTIQPGQQEIDETINITYQVR